MKKIERYEQSFSIDSIAISQIKQQQQEYAEHQLLDLFNNFSYLSKRNPKNETATTNFAIWLTCRLKNQMTNLEEIFDKYYKSDSFPFDHRRYTIDICQKILLQAKMQNTFGQNFFFGLSQLIKNSQYKQLLLQIANQVLQEVEKNGQQLKNINEKYKLQKRFHAQPKRKLLDFIKFVCNNVRKIQKFRLRTIQKKNSNKQYYENKYHVHKFEQTQYIDSLQQNKQNNINKSLFSFSIKKEEGKKYKEYYSKTNEKTLKEDEKSISIDLNSSVSEDEKQSNDQKHQQYKETKSRYNESNIHQKKEKKQVIHLITKEFLYTVFANYLFIEFFQDSDLLCHIVSVYYKSKGFHVNPKRYVMSVCRQIIQKIESLEKFIGLDINHSSVPTFIKDTVENPNLREIGEQVWKRVKDIGNNLLATINKYSYGGQTFHVSPRRQMLDFIQLVENYVKRIEYIGQTNRSRFPIKNNRKIILQILQLYAPNLGQIVDQLNILFLSSLLFCFIQLFLYVIKISQNC